MEGNAELVRLREFALAAENLEATRWLTLSLSVVLVAVILWLVRRRSLREEYTPIWLLVAAAMTVLSLRLDILAGITRAIGAWTPSSTVFFLGELFLLAICLNYAVRLSTAGVQIKNLAQDMAILRAELESLQGQGAGAGASTRDR